ncbi:MAG: 1-acyl-sn-glycerol-3-phosphate acyltransferase [bacterium]|nr:1-acyl-sn-glycerol-3-phosphate acyltransferase [bacterium]
MSRPQITPENGPAIYKFYLNHPSKYSRYGQMAMSQIWRPRTLWAPGVEDATRQQLGAGKALLWTANHRNHHDQYIVAAAGYREEALDRTVGNYWVAVRPDLAEHPIKRLPIDGMGSIPVYRYKDFLDKDGNPNQRLLTYQKKLTESFFETTVARSERGEMGFMFFQGERDKAETGQLEKGKLGIGEIATRIDGELDPAILVSGFHYPTFRGTNKKNRLRPTMVMGALLTDLPNDPREVIDLIVPHMQSAMDWAKEITPELIYSK